MTRETVSSHFRLLAVILFMALLTGALFVSGCTTTGKDPVTGTWEWSDGKGYSERYTFNTDQSFYAQALGSKFNGTWAAVSPGHYMVTYHNQEDPGHNGTLTEQVLYDSKTDAIYFPAHQRVL
jgi:hypothetical protein